VPPAQDTVGETPLDVATALIGADRSLATCQTAMHWKRCWPA